MGDFKDISELNELVGSTELDLDALESAAGGFDINDFTPEEKLKYKAMCDELERLCKLANADSSYNGACKRCLGEIDNFINRIKKRAEAKG